MIKATDQEWRQLVQATSQIDKAPVIPVPDPLARVLRFGLAVRVDTDGQVKVAGVLDLEGEERTRAITYVREHREAIKLQVQAIAIFGAAYPGHCAGCKAYARNWPITKNGVRHTEWCVYDAYFLGKAGKPIRLEIDAEEPFKNWARCPKNNQRKRRVRK
jgi:hypothetical protein